MLNRAELECRLERHHERLLRGDRIGRLPASEKLPPAVTRSELRVLSALAVLRYACVDRLTLYLNSYKRGIQRTLEVLRNKRLVAWFRWTDTKNVKEGIGTLPTIPVYCLTTRGVERCILDRMLEDGTNILTRSWRGKPVIQATVPHQLGIVDIIIGLQMASRRSTTHEVLDVVPDFVNTKIEGKRRAATTELFGTPDEFRPDLIACTRAKNSGALFTLYIEFERKNKERKEIEGKFVSYSKLFLKKERRFNSGKPVLLYVVADGHDDRYTADRIKLVSSWAKGKPVAPAVRFSSLTPVLERAFSDIWTKVDGSRWSISS